MTQMKTMRVAKEMMKRVSMIAVLLSGVILAGTSLASAQDCIRGEYQSREQFEDLVVQVKADANRNCWERKARSGEKDLRGAYLLKVNLSKADLSGTNLSTADLTEANLIGANLRGADLSGAVLIGANLSGADLTGADLRDAILDMAATLKQMVAALDTLKKENPSIDLGEAELGERFWVRILPDNWGIPRELLRLEIESGGGDLFPPGAVVSRSTTKGVDFDDWKKRGGKVVD